MEQSKEKAMFALNTHELQTCKGARLLAGSGWGGLWKALHTLGKADTEETKKGFAESFLPYHHGSSATGPLGYKPHQMPT